MESNPEPIGETTDHKDEPQENGSAENEVPASQPPK